MTPQQEKKTVDSTKKTKIEMLKLQPRIKKGREYAKKCE